MVAKRITEKDIEQEKSPYYKGVMKTLLATEKQLRKQLKLDGEHSVKVLEIDDGYYIRISAEDLECYCPEPPMRR